MAYSEQSPNGRVQPPTMGDLPWLNGEKPTTYYDKCREYENKWERERNEKVAKVMEHFSKAKSIILVTNTTLGSSMPKEMKESSTLAILKTELDSSAESPSLPICDEDKDAELGKTSKFQAIKRMKAHRRLHEASKRKEEFSEDLIKETHRIVMTDLLTDGVSSQPGTYRSDEAYAGDYVFPSPEVIPGRVATIVAEYNKRAEASHDRIDLAAWLFHKMITLHPFKDGNGRTCRLLWCYSLMRDGLPFPLIMSSGHRKSYKHYIETIRKCQSKGCHSYLTTLTAISICNAWSNFFENLSHSCQTMTDIDI